MRGRSCVPDAPRRWRPKTRTAALAALAVARRYAARLAAIARDQEIRERALRDELEKLKASTAAQAKALTETTERLTKTEQQRNEKTKESFKRKRQTERLIDRLQRTEREVSRKEKALEQARADLASLRQQHEQQGSQLADAKTELAEMSRTREDLASTVKKLEETTEQLEQRATDAEQKVKQSEHALDVERKQAEEAMRSRDESQAHAELLQRRLEAEQARRTALEQKIEQSASTSGSSPASNTPSTQPTSGAASLGRYRELASALGYDPSTDRLFELMREEVRVAAAYSDWQAKHMERITARRRDVEQSLDEQAFAAAMAVRWHLVDHPHLRIGAQPRWKAGWGNLDARSEKYLLMIASERIAEMQSRMHMYE